MSLAIATCGDIPAMRWPVQPSTPTGWLLHVSAKNVLVTHVAPVAGERSGVCVRILETEGRGTQAKLAAFRPFVTARSTDFLGMSTGVLSVDEGLVQFDIGPHQWLQIEAEW
jgi:hypothetical protein